MPKLQDLFRSPNPVALITGSGAPRVGRVIAKHLLDLGCCIALHAHRSITEAEATAREWSQSTGREVLVTHGSLADDDIAVQMVQQIQRAFGRLDIVVNSAAIWAPKPLEEVTSHDLREYFQINAVGSFNLARAAGLQMVTQPSGGCIVNIGDWATVRPYLDHAAYFPSKGSIEVMTRSLAVELASRNRNVRVNCVLPGPVLLTDEVTNDEKQRLEQSTLVGRVGSPEAIAHAVQFLCENDFVTGVCLPVDGGRSIYAPDGLQVGLNTG